MTPNKKNELVEWVKTILTSIGFTHVVTSLNKVTNTETCFFPESKINDKTVSFVVLNEEVANATRKRFGDWNIDDGITAESTGLKNTYWKLSISFRALGNAKALLLNAPVRNTQKEKTKERVYIEKLLFGKGVAPRIDQGEDDFWFTITFRKPKDCDDAKKLLSNANIDYDDSGGKTTLFVLVSLPDALFKEEIVKESEVDQKARHISEYYGRLILLVNKTLGFTIKHTYGPKHKGEKYVSISGDKGSRRLEFCDKKQKKAAEIHLMKAGFSCYEPEVDKEYVIMVNLSKSTQATLTQNIVVEEATN
jgi:hypothetical protein